MERTQRIRSLFKAEGKGLEIGPSHNPLMPKAAGFDVEILDYLDGKGLRRKYADAGLDVSDIEEVDYVSDGRRMVDVIGDRHRYDWIVASHVIEHVPDLVAFLCDCEALLKPEGSLILAVPDKRCCFDVLRPVSTIGQILQAHVDGRTRPPPGVIFDDVAYARKRNGNIGWALGEQSPLEEVRPIDDARQLFEMACDSDAYVDMHCWVFVPSSFRMIINALSMLGRTGLRELRFQPGEGEFYTVLSRQAEPVSFDLGSLALAAQAEEREAALGSSAAQPAVKQLLTLLDRLERELASLKAGLTAELCRRRHPL
jgi:hypothetical protein